MDSLGLFMIAWSNITKTAILVQVWQEVPFEEALSRLSYLYIMYTYK